MPAKPDPAAPTELTFNLDEFERHFQAMKRDVGGKDSVIRQLKDEGNAKDDKIRQLQEDADGMVKKIAELEQRADDGRDDQIRLLQSICDGNIRRIHELQEEADGKDRKIVELQDEFVAKDGKISELEQKLAEVRHFAKFVTTGMGNIVGPGENSTAETSKDSFPAKPTTTLAATPSRDNKPTKAAAADTKPTVATIKPTNSNKPRAAGIANISRAHLESADAPEEFVDRSTTSSNSFAAGIAVRILDSLNSTTAASVSQATGSSIAFTTAQSSSVNYAPPRPMRAAVTAAKLSISRVSYYPTTEPNQKYKGMSSSRGPSSAQPQMLSAFTSNRPLPSKRGRPRKSAKGSSSSEFLPYRRPADHTFVCDQCGSEFANVALLNRHTLSAHSLLA